ncbi:unnamed protein product, partial [Closterium sp. NIES-54]
EDRILLAHVARHGTKKWRLIKSMGLLPTRNHKSCCNRFIVLTRKLSRLHQLSEASDPGAEMVSEVPKESSRLHGVTGLPGMAAEATMPMAWTKDMAMLNMQTTLKERADCDPLSCSSFSDYQDEDACRRSAAEELLESGSEEHRNLSEGVAEELLESRSEEHQTLFEGVVGELFEPGCEAAQNSCEETAEELLLESGSERHQNVYRKVAEERFYFATPDFQPGAAVPATNRGIVEEEEEALDLETDEAAEETMLGITSPAVAAAVIIASAPVSPILGFNPIETFLLGETPQQQQVIQQERVFNACSSMQGEADCAPDQDAACANGVSACANSGGQPGIDNYQCSCVGWDGTAFLSSLADLLPPVAAPGAGAAQEPLPPGGSVPPDVVNPGCAIVALADGSDWLAAADNAIASFLIEAELIRINKVLLQAESAPYSNPLSSSPNSSLTAIQDRGSERLSSQSTLSTHPNHSDFHASPMQVTTPTTTELLPAMPSTVCMSTPSLLSPLPSYAAATPLFVDRPFSSPAAAAAAPPPPATAAAPPVATYTVGPPRCVPLSEPRGSEAVSMEGCLRPDELFEAWCNSSFSR